MCPIHRFFLSFSFFSGRISVAYTSDQNFPKTQNAIKKPRVLKIKILILIKFFKLKKLTEIIGDKVINLMLSMCVRLNQLNLGPNSKYPNEPDVFNPIFNQLFDDQEDPQPDLTLSDRLSEDKGSLFVFTLICLDLLVKFNDGNANSFLVPSIKPDNKRSKMSILNELCTILFQTKLPDNSQLKIIYLKFLIKLFDLNFKNLIKQNLPNSLKAVSNAIFLCQFNIIQSSKEITILSNLLRLTIEYIYNFALSCGLVTNSRSKNTTTPNIASFTAVLSLLEPTASFIIAHLHLTTDGLYTKVIDIIVEIKSFKNYQEHSQICLRGKHSHLTCKTSLIEINTKHNDVTNLSGHCLFSKIIKLLFHGYHEFNINHMHNKMNKIKFIDIINKFGVCTCVDLNELLDMFRLKETYVYSDDLCTSFCDYIYITCTTNDDTHRVPTSPTGLELKKPSRINSQRRSTFFPLLVEESLISQSVINFKNNDVFKLCFTIIRSRNEKSLLLCRYLSSSLVKFNKFLPEQKVSSPQAIKFKWITNEIFYLYEKVLRYLVRLMNGAGDISGSEDDSDENITKSELNLVIFELIIKYFKDFLELWNTYSNFTSEDEVLLTTTPTTNVSKTFSDRKNLTSNLAYDSVNSNHQVEMKINTKFVSFVSKNAVDLHENIIELCVLFNRAPNLHVCSQLILFKHLHSSNSENIEQHLCKAFIQLIDQNHVMLDDYSTLDTILELFVKCSAFRIALIECQHFHLSLLTCLEDFFNHPNIDTNPKGTKFLEVLLDLIFVYFYFNRKVASFLFCSI